MSGSYVDTFNDDYNNGFVGKGSDLQKWLDEWNGYVQSVKDYHAGMARIAKTSDAMVAFTMLMWLMANQGCAQEQSQLAVDAGALKIQGDLTKLNNDIEDLTNQDSKDPQLLINAAQHLDKMLDLLNQDDVKHIIGDDATKALSGQFLILRHQIHWSGETNPNYNPPEGTTYYFDPDDPKYIQSYGELQDDLSARGDPKQASEAEKQKTDAFNANTSTTQSTNAASQQTISSDSNILKSVQAFATDGFHAIMDLISASIKAVTRG